MENHVTESSGLLTQIGDFAKHIPIGVAKGTEEILQTVRVLDDNAWNLPDPETIGGSLGQGIGQFLPLFGVGGWAIKGGFKLANLFQKSQKLAKAGAALTAVGAGALSDFTAFDPKDKNMGNLALSIGAVANDPRASAAVKKYLAQQDEDSELAARSKNALTGMVAGVIVEGLLRTTGYALKKTGVIKPKDETIPDTPTTSDDILEDPIEDSLEKEAEEVIEGVDEVEPTTPIKDQDINEKELEPGALDIAKDFTDILESMKNTPDGAARIKESFKELPDEIQGAVGAAEREKNSIAGAWERMERESPELSKAVTEAIEKIANGETLPNQDLTVTIKEGKRAGEVVPLIESMNFLKLETTADARNALQFISAKLDIKKLQKPKLSEEDRDLNSIIPELLDQFIDTTDADAVAGAIEEISKAASSIDDAIKYVGTSKVLAKIAYRKVVDAAKKDGVEATEESAKRLYQHQLALENILRAGGLLSKKSSDLLNSFKGQRALDNKDLLTAELLKIVQKTPKKLTVKKAKSIEVIEAQDQVSAKVYAEDLKTSRNVKASKGETKTGKKYSKQVKRLTDGQRLLNKIKNLKKILRSEKAPERGAPFPKLRPVTSNEVKKLKAEIKKVREERSTLEFKNAKILKNQLKLRKKFEKISDDIKQLREGKDPNAGKVKKGETTVDIEKLKAERSRLKKEFNEVNKTQRIIDAKSTKLNNLLLKRIGKAQRKGGELDPREIPEIEKQLDDAIKRENKKIKERVTRQELEETLIAKGTRELNSEIADMTLRQLKTRVQSLNKSFLAKTGNAWMEMYINGLLSSVKTFGAVNPLGNVSALFTTIIERAFAGATGNQIAMKESVELAWNSISGLPEAWKTFRSALVTGPKDLDVKLDFSDPRTRAISKEAFNVGGNLGKLIDYVGSFVNLPGKILLAQDEAFKGLTFRGEQRALAYRKARNKYSKSDLSKADIKVAIQKEYDNIVRDLDAHPDITEAARQQAAKNTYTNPLPDYEEIDPRSGKTRVVKGLSRHIQAGLDKHGFLRVFIPFFRTPVNILNFAWERTPLLQFANRTLRDELRGGRNADPAVKQLAYAKIGTSTAIWGTFFSMAMTGNFTGAPPRDPNERKAQEAKMGGRHWNSIYIGGGWRKYDRLDPYGLMLAASANMAVMAKSMINLRGKFEEEGDPSGLIREKYDEMINASIIGTVEMIKDRHYLQGLSELIDFVSGDERKLSQSIKRAATFADPTISLYSSIRRNSVRGLNPDKQRKLQRNVGLPEDELGGLGEIIDELDKSWEEAKRDVIPGYGKILPQKNLAGEVVSYPGLGQEYNVMENLITSLTNPSPALDPSKSPIIHKLAELNSNVEQPSSVNKMGNIVLNEEEKSFIIDKWTSLNKLVLEPIIKSKGFNKNPEGIQKLIMENTIRANKRAAKKLALGQFKRLQTGYTQYMLQDAQRKIIDEQPQTQQSSLVPIGQ